jgi:hypothetical protein
MHMVLSVGFHCSRFSCSCFDFKRCCWGDRGRTSLALIVHRPAVHPAASSYLPRVASSTVSMGDLAMVPLGSSWLMVTPRETLALEEPMPESREAPRQ